MHKKIKVVISLVAIMLAIGTTTLSYASPVNDLKQALITAGVPDNYIGNAVEYLQKINLTQAKVNAVKAKINKASSLTGGVKDLSTLDKSVKSQIKNLVIEAAKILGLTANFGKDVNGKTTVSFLTPSGSILGQLTTTNAKNLKSASLINVLNIALTLKESDNSNNKQNDTPVYKPIGNNTLNNTSTNYQAMMIYGTTMMGMATTMRVVSKKRK